MRDVTFLWYESCEWICMRVVNRFVCELWMVLHESCEWFCMRIVNGSAWELWMVLYECLCKLVIGFRLKLLLNYKRSVYLIWESSIVHVKSSVNKRSEGINKHGNICGLNMYIEWTEIWYTQRCGNILCRTFPTRELRKRPQQNTIGIRELIELWLTGGARI